MRILIADDHAIVRRGMKQLLLEQYPFVLIGEVADAAQLVKELMDNTWDLIICDINMPGRSGLDVLQQVRDMSPDIPVLIMSMYPEEQYAVRALRLGAAGYLGKESLDDNLIPAIEMVMRGKKFITPAIAEKLADAVGQGDKKNNPHDELSLREFEVFKQLAAGNSVSEIAAKLSVSPNTVSTYRSRIFEKMGFRSSAELVRYAVEHKLI
jgi:DNA-binding NarL/FixJ family response regulator